MGQRKTTVVEVKDVSVDVCENCSVDIRCGGPQFVGYDFCVAYEVPSKEVRSFIEKCLKESNLPCRGITISRSKREVPYKSVWTRKKIAKEIRENDVTIGTPTGRFR